MTFSEISNRYGKPTYKVDGREVSKAEYDRLFAADRAALPQVSEARASTAKGKGWPRKSDSMAVHPSQRKEAMAEADKLGVPTHYEDDGRPIIRDRNHNRRLAQALGYHSLDGGYGDASRKSDRRPGY